MVLQRLPAVLALSSLWLVATSAFSTPTASHSRPVTRSSPSVLHAGVVLLDDENDEDFFLMTRATACADGSETCSLEEAQSYLDEILMIQKDCLDETLESVENSALCQNVDGVAEVVANLRQKIQQERTKIAPLHLANVVVGVYVMSTILHGLAAVPNVPVDAPWFTSFDSAVSTVDGRGVATILPQEWFWSMRDGYFPMLFKEWLSNGGLAVDMSQFDDKVVAFTPQEWVWSLQNGSFGNLLEENMRYGGYRVGDPAFDNDGVVPMTGQDVLWSIQGGYFDTAVKHFFRNGGV